MTRQSYDAQRPIGEQAATPTRQELRALKRELEIRLRRYFPPSALTVDGRLKDWRDNLMAAIDVRDLPPRRGLEAQLRRVESPIALACNSFLPWRDRLHHLELAGVRGLKELRLLLLCPTGARGTPPTLIGLARGPDGIVAVEPVAFDYLAPATGALTPCDRQRLAAPQLAAWRAVHDAWEAGKMPIIHLALARLLKLALALERNFAEPARYLLYLFLEPPAEAGSSPFVRHRQELAWLAACTADSPVRFAFASFADLWERWQIQAPAPELRELGRSLRARYLAPLTRAQGLAVVPAGNG